MGIFGLCVWASINGCSVDYTAVDILSAFKSILWVDACTRAVGYAVLVEDGLDCIVLYPYIYIALLTVHTNQKRFYSTFSVHVNLLSSSVQEKEVKSRIHVSSPKLYYQIRANCITRGCLRRSGAIAGQNHVETKPWKQYRSELIEIDVHQSISRSINVRSDGYGSVGEFELSSYTGGR